jgi:hypothetical protein
MPAHRVEHRANIGEGLPHAAFVHAGGKLNAVTAPMLPSARCRLHRLAAASGSNQI